MSEPQACPQCLRRSWLLALPGTKPPSSLVSDLAKQAELLAALQREAEQGSERAQREVDEGRADLNAAALDQIQTALSDQDRTSESLDDVAEILRAAGFPVPYRVDSDEEERSDGPARP